MAKLHTGQILEMRALAAEGATVDGLARRFGLRFERVIEYLAGGKSDVAPVIPRAKREAPDFGEPRYVPGRR